MWQFIGTGQHVQDCHTCHELFCVEGSTMGRGGLPAFCFRRRWDVFRSWFNLSSGGELHFSLPLLFNLRISFIRVPFYDLAVLCIYLYIQDTSSFPLSRLLYLCICGTRTYAYTCSRTYLRFTGTYRSQYELVVLHTSEAILICVLHFVAGSLVKGTAREKNDSRI
jgi:hypothetical protein